jgi:LPXTG-motif cell wall-anchored protein
VIRLWDPATGALTQKLEATNNVSNNIWAVAYSPDGKQLASSCGNDVVRLWDLATGALMQMLNTTFIPFSLADLPDGKQPASATLPTSASTSSTSPIHTNQGSSPASTSSTSSSYTNPASGPRQHGSLSTGAEAGIGAGVGAVIILGIGLLLLRRKQKSRRGVAPIEKSQERFAKPELHDSDLPRTHGRAELDARVISELDGFPVEGSKNLHVAEEVFEKEP